MRPYAVLSFFSIALFALTAARPSAADGVHASLQPSVVSIAANGIVTVKLAIFQADAPFNALDAYIMYDNTRLQFVAGSNQADSLANAACANKFQIFKNRNVQPADPDTLELNFTLLCAGAVMVGPGPVYRVQFKAFAAPPPGVAPISFVGETGFYNEGLNVTPVELRNTSVLVGCPSITLGPPSLPAGAVGVPYSQSLNASGGAGTYGFSLTGGSLPAGLTLAPDGLLSGPPSAAGVSSFTVTATDATGCSGTRTYSLVVCAPISIAPTTLPGAVAGTPYSQNLTASGGTAPYTFSIAAGALPPGLGLSAAGAITGTPTTTGTFGFDVAAVDANGCGGSQSLQIVVACGTIVIAPATLPHGVPGTSYSQQLTASGGTPPYTFTLDSGTIPAGMALSSSGLLAGTPEIAGTSNFVVRASGADGCSGTAAYTLVIDCRTIAITPTTLPQGTIHYAYSQPLTANGGAPPYTFALTGGSLPAGLALAANGVVSGTPDAVGTFTFDATATDASGCTGTVRDTVTIIGVLGAGDGPAVRTFAFESPRPNPRTGLAAARLRFALPTASRVGFELLDAAGRVVAKRAGEGFAAGRHEVAWTPQAAPPGLYFLNVTVDGRVVARERWVMLR